MRKEFVTRRDENIVVDYSTFSGRIVIFYNGIVAEKYARRFYRAFDENGVHTFYVDGGYFSGLRIFYDQTSFPVLERVPWYCYVLASLPLIMTMILGNMGELTKYGFYYVGGFIGGGLSGLLGVLGIAFSRGFPRIWQRILVFFVILVATFLLCLGIGNLIAMWFPKQ